MRYHKACLLLRSSIVLLLAVVTFAKTSAQSTKQKIKGHITTKDGKPAPNVRIHLTGDGEHKFAETNENGDYEFNVKNGTYTLIIKAMGIESISKSITVPPASDEELNIQINESYAQLDSVIIQGAHSNKRAPLSIAKAGIPVMDMPQATMVIGEDVIVDQQAQRLSDVMRNVNGVYLGTTRGSTQESFFARGYNLGSTNTFKNGFRVNSGAMPEMSSIESVEVLKGSAALLYGNVAPGGIINMVTKKPKFVFGGDIGMRAGSYGLYKPTIDIYGPISQSIAYRVNGTYEKMNSYRDEVHSKRFYLNPSFLFKLGSKTKLLVQGDYLWHDFTPDFGIGTMSTQANVYGGKIVPDVKRSTFFGTPWQFAKTKQTTASFELNHELSKNWQLNVLGGYQSYSRDYFSTERVQIDGTGKFKRPLGKSKNEQDYYTGQIYVNGNFKTGKIDHKLLFGADYENDRSATISSDLKANTIYDSINIFDPSLYTVRTDMPEYNWISKALNPVTRFGGYVQDLITLSEKFKFLAGVRWSFQQADRTKTTNLTNGNVATGATLQIDKAFSPRFGLVYQPTNNTSVYASYANSFSPNSGLDVDSATLKPSIIDQYELGVKNILFNGLLTANLTLYRIVNNNLTQPIQTFKDGTAVIGTTTLRELTGQTTSDGIEVDLQAKPISGLDIMAGYSYNNMRYTKTSGKVGSYVEGERLVNSPAHTANATTFYTIQTGNVKGLKFGVGAYYIGNRNAGWNSQYAGTNSNLTINDRLFEVKGFITLDISAGYTYKKVSLLAKISNITNTYNYYVHENYSINPIPPRQFMTTLNYKF
ncbi:MAG: TonB-dependent siderophore receptor [Pseudopedobacter saltans]|uniref:TonB-dependent siderophore receptor n=1 Tax=Pseudopedobacter saltans TaxID=151895 RepID=A0A2W5H9I7_9SPHI|nr:MAG: TonB-dependent siderophore receptor [Pseudopedobacter saltans]